LGKKARKGVVVWSDMFHLIKSIPVGGFKTVLAKTGYLYVVKKRIAGN
jgi:hypothetical protein